MTSSISILNWFLWWTIQKLYCRMWYFIHVTSCHRDSKGVSFWVGNMVQEGNILYGKIFLSIYMATWRNICYGFELLVMSTRANPHFLFSDAAIIFERSSIRLKLTDCSILIEWFSLWINSFKLWYMFICSINQSGNVYGSFGTPLKTIFLFIILLHMFFHVRVSLVKFKIIGFCVWLFSLFPLYVDWQTFKICWHDR